jgi:hypothetical protein
LIILAPSFFFVFFCFFLPRLVGQAETELASLQIDTKHERGQLEDLKREVELLRQQQAQSSERMIAMGSSTCVSIHNHCPSM